MRKPRKAIELTSYEDILGIDDAMITGQEKVIDVPLTDLHAFKNHPFYVRDEDLREIVNSIKENGILVPGVVRPRAHGGYELISGHRRKRACELAGKETMQVICRNYTDDQAVIVMVDANIQRENILPSEKAYAYAMKLEAMRHQGMKGTETDDTAELIGKKAGDSGRKVQRFIRLTKLVPVLLDMVDEGKIKFIPAVSLSYLSEEEQNWVVQCVLSGEGVSGAKAETLKEQSQKGILTASAVESILHGKKQPERKMTLPENKIRSFFPEEYDKRQIEEVIYHLLENWKKSQ